ncbi:MAG: hypothetical protein K0R24_348 [Gammaproteobacteria bacterium]|jgi:conjugal transfer pilus assembly protein TraL|nr:hypothetical protein [Gammaproteobacteria bacterium]
MDKHYIPQYLDSPFKLILWTVDEIVLFIVPFFSFLLILNAPLMGFLLGAGLIMALKKIKGEEGHHFILHLVYWYLPPLVLYKVTPPSHIREIIG